VPVDLSHLKHVDGIGPFEEIGKGGMIGFLHGVLIGFGLDGVFHAMWGYEWQPS